MWTVWYKSGLNNVSIQRRSREQEKSALWWDFVFEAKAANYSVKIRVKCGKNTALSFAFLWYEYVIFVRTAFYERRL